MKLKHFIIILFTCFYSTAIYANELGQRFTIKSKHLNEERTIVVSLPSNYEDEPFYEYPVLYLTDASSQLEHTATMIHYLSGAISPMIVVGIFTPARWDELKPYTRDKQVNIRAESVRKFIVEEVKGFIEKNYRTIDYSILVGHSLGGSFVANAYLKGPDDFNVFFALAPNFAMGSEVMFDLLEESFAKSNQPKVYFMFEGITPFTTPTNSYARLDHMMLKYPHLKTSHRVRIFENEDHMSVSHIGLYEGLNELYKDWFLYIPAILYDKTIIKSHYDSLSRRIGYEVKPTEFYFRDLISALIRMGKVDTAEYAAKIAKDKYPVSHFSYASLAAVAKANKQLDKETEYLKRAIELSVHDSQRHSQYKKSLANL